MYDFLVRHQDVICISIALTVGMIPFFIERMRNEDMFKILRNVYHYAENHPDLQDMILRTYVEHGYSIQDLIGKEYKDCD